MGVHKLTFPQYPDVHVLLAYFPDVLKTKLASVKENLVSRNPEYDFCFLSTANLVSLQQLQNGIYTAVRNQKQEQMKASTIYTEIMLSLSPVNNINEALKRFGVDETRNDIIVLKVVQAEQLQESEKEFSAKLESILDSKPGALTDDVLYNGFDATKFKKLFKLLGVESQAELTQGAIEGALFRGL